MDQVLFNADLITIIFSQNNIVTAPDYKAIITTCHIWYNAIKSKAREHTLMNVISTFIKQNQDLRPIAIHFGSNITSDAALLCNPYDDLDRIHFINTSPHLTLDVINKFKDRISMDDPSCNQYLPVEVLRELKDELNWHYISGWYAFTNETYEEFKSYITVRICSNPHLTWEIIDDLMKSDYATMLVKSPITFLTSIQFDYERFAVYIADKSHLISQNPHLTPQFIRDFADKLHWKLLSSNRALTLPLIREFIDRVDWRNLVLNINITEDFIYENIDKIHMDYIRNMPLSHEFICKFEDKLSWFGLANNQYLTLETIEKYKTTHLKIHWINWIVLPCITIDFLTQNRDFIDELRIMQDEFDEVDGHD